MQVRKLKRILKETKAEIVVVKKPIFRYLTKSFELTEGFADPWAVGSLRTFTFDTEEEIAKRFRRSKLFVKSCSDGDKLTVKAFEWREKPWLT